MLHDVVRDFLRGELKRQQRLASLDEALVDAVAGALRPPLPARAPPPAWRGLRGGNSTVLTGICGIT